MGGIPDSSSTNFQISKSEIKVTKPIYDVTPNTWEFLKSPMIKPTGFREYDARWKFPDEINLPGMTALGLGIGTQMRKHGLEPVIAVGNDYRDYSLAIKNALVIGLMQAKFHLPRAETRRIAAASIGRPEDARATPFERTTVGARAPMQLITV